MQYDVAIVGASFAGLAVASKLGGNSLLIDRKEIGSHQASACGTLVKTMEAVGCENSILQTFDEVALHVGDAEITIPVPDRFCTIDYEKFCKTFFKRSSASFVKANALGVKNNEIITADKGNFKAKILVDCSGWSAVLAKAIDRDYVKNDMMSFGIETEVPFEDDKLRFFLDNGIIGNGAAWLFPAGKKSRFGVGSYKGETRLVENLKALTDKYGVRIGKIHGGYFCYSLKRPCVGNVFVAGCAAGQTLPLSGEGIRRSIIFGLKCGEVLQQVLDGKLPAEEGRKIYEDFALRYRTHYQYLLKLQESLPKIAPWQIKLAARLLSFKPIGTYSFREYEKI
ncbi:NAD(P)/FAD-dependent oxidoreductase [Candidatus Micrarchaeota archaeon]|nr:NAD(P)/FAD-dependent oxidoreductase [Candidatus Micrarchaeota archaeon]